jgi:hypothetical protein
MEMIMPNQTYRMSEEVISEFTTRFFFNQTTDVLNVEKVSF